jgi:putative transposase
MLNKQQRGLIVRLKQDGKKQQQIADLIGCSQAAVSKWISKYESGRTLDTLPRSGRPTKLTSKRLKKLRNKLLSEVKEANKKFCSLSTKQLSSIIKDEIGRQYSIRHIERIMHKLGFSLIKPRPKHLKQDPKKVAKFKEEFKKNWRRSTWVISS